MYQCVPFDDLCQTPTLNSGSFISILEWLSMCKNALKRSNYLPFIHLRTPLDEKPYNTVTILKLFFFFLQPLEDEAFFYLYDEYIGQYDKDVDYMVSTATPAY